MMTWLLGTRIGRWFGMVGAAALAFASVYLAGRRSAKKQAEIDDLKAYQDTRRKADEADLSTGDVDDDLGVLRDFHERGGRN